MDLPAIRSTHMRVHNEGASINSQEARELGKRIGVMVQSWQITQAYNLLAPILAKRTPFRLLGFIRLARIPLSLLRSLSLLRG